MPDPIELQLRLYSHSDDEGGYWRRFLELSHFWKVVQNALGIWQGQDRDGSFGSWERKRKDLVVDAILERTKYLEVANFDGENAGWQLFPADLLKQFLFPDLAEGTVPKRNFLLRQNRNIELVEGWTIYIDVDFAEDAFRELTKDVDLTPSIPVGYSLSTRAEIEAAYEKFYIALMLEKVLQRPTVVERVSWIQQNLNVNRDRARDIELSKRPAEWNQKGRRPEAPYDY
ncbi:MULTISPECIES: hypothetical protein [unclassified Roseovarius]|uniref:hypothetical protein n=1 Tax=unclassified Roseovarius TaxID=2614913 RepID=UPI00273D1561|nr:MULTISPECIES: hypothetical protein [unclassified Roseovarius]